MTKKITEDTLKNLILDVLTEATEEEARAVAQQIKDNGGSRREAIMAIRGIDDSGEISMKDARNIVDSMGFKKNSKSKKKSTNKTAISPKEIFGIEEPKKRKSKKLTQTAGDVDLSNFDDGYVAGYDLIDNNGDAKPIYLTQKAAQMLFDLDPFQSYLKFTKVGSSRISESFIKKINEKKGFSKLAQEIPKNIFKVEPTEKFLDLKTKMRQIDALNDKDSKYESEDMSNLEIFTADLPRDQKQWYIDTFQTLKSFQTLTPDSKYDSENFKVIEKGNFVEKKAIEKLDAFYETSLSVRDIKSSMVLKKCFIVTSKNRSFFNSEPEEKFYVDVVNKMTKVELKKLFKPNTQFKIQSPGFPPIESVKPLLTPEKMWSSVTSVTSEMSEDSLNKVFLKNYMQRAKIDDSLIQSKICKGWTPGLEFDTGTDEYKKQEGFLTIFVKNYGSNELNKLNFLGMPFFITMFDNILSYESLPDGLVKRMLDYVRNPSNTGINQAGSSLELDESKKRKIISEIRNKASFLKAYANSNWANANDRGRSMLSQAERILVSKQDVSDLGTSTTDQFPPSGLGTDDLAIDKGATSTAASGDFVGNMAFDDAGEFQVISSATQNQTNLDPELVKLFSGTFSKLTNNERLELITMFAKHITQAPQNDPTNFEKYVSKYELSGFDLYNLGRICTLMFDASKKISGGNVGAMFEGLLTYLFVAPGTGTQTVSGKQGPVDNVFATFSSSDQKNYLFSSAKVYTSLGNIRQNYDRMVQVLDTGADVIYFIFKKAKSSLSPSEAGRADEYDEIRVVVSRCYKDGEAYKWVHLDSSGNETSTKGNITRDSKGKTKVCGGGAESDVVAYTIPVIEQGSNDKSMFEDAFQAAVSNMNSKVGKLVQGLTEHFDSIEKYKKEAQKRVSSNVDLNSMGTFLDLIELSKKLDQINITAYGVFGIGRQTTNTKTFIKNKSLRLSKDEKLEEDNFRINLTELAKLISESFKK